MKIWNKITKKETLWRIKWRFYKKKVKINMAGRWVWCGKKWMSEDRCYWKDLMSLNLRIIIRYFVFSDFFFFFWKKKNIIFDFIIKRYYLISRKKCIDTEKWWKIGVVWQLTLLCKPFREKRLNQNQLCL